MLMSGLFLIIRGDGHLGTNLVTQTGKGKHNYCCDFYYGNPPVNSCIVRKPLACVTWLSVQLLPVWKHQW